MIKKKYKKYQNKSSIYENREDREVLGIEQGNNNNINNIKKIKLFKEGENRQLRKGNNKIQRLPELKIGKQFSNKISIIKQIKQSDNISPNLISGQIDKDNSNSNNNVFLLKKNKKANANISMKEILFPEITLNKPTIKHNKSSNAILNQNSNNKNESKFLLPKNKKTNIRTIKVNRDINSNNRIDNSKTINFIQFQSHTSDITIKQNNNYHNRMRTNFSCNSIHLMSLNDTTSSNRINITHNNLYKSHSNKNFMKFTAKTSIEGLTEKIPIPSRKNPFLHSFHCNSIDINTIEPTKNIINISPIKSPCSISPLLTNLSLSHFTHPSLFSSQSNKVPICFNSIIEEYGMNSCNGIIRNYNEDTISIIPRFIDKGYYFSIYDGHGGKGCSSFLKVNLHSFITSFDKKSIEDSIRECERIFLQNYAINSQGDIIDSSGSCALIVLVTNDNKCIVINIGDSRCLIISKDNKIVFTTKDHKPNEKSEYNRIVKAGGSIYQHPISFPLLQYGEVIKKGPYRVNPGGLSVSRTIGDIEAKDEKYGGNNKVIISIPDIYIIDNINQYKYIIMGCDGIFDVLNEEEIIYCIALAEREFNDRNISAIAVDYIIKAAMIKDSFDNLSCIVIKLNGYL